MVVLPLITWVLCGAASSGCGGAVHDLPSWEQPLDAVNKATDPGPEAGNPYPEKLNTVVGTTSSYTWVHARGWVDMPVEDVWKAMENVNVIVDRRNLKSWSVTKTNVDPTAAWSADVYNVIQNVFTITLTTEWREGPLQGTVAKPVQVAARNELLETSLFVSVLEDSMLLNTKTSGVTEVQFERHSKTLSPNPQSDCVTYENDLFNSIVAYVHGKPLPTY